MSHPSLLSRYAGLALTGLCSTMLLACNNNTQPEEPIFVIEEPDPVCDGYIELPIDADALAAVPDGEIGTITLVDSFAVEHPEGRSQELCVNVPENVLSLAITVEGHNRDTLTLGSWLGPDSFPIVRSGWNTAEQICTDCNNRIASHIGAFAALAPNSPDSHVEPGRHIFTIDAGRAANAFSQPNPISGSARVSVHAKVVGGEVPESGTLDLNIFFSGSNGWTAASAPGDADFQQMLDEVREIYAQIDIEIGEIAYLDVEEEFQDVSDVTATDGELARLLANSERAPLDGPSLFMVDRLRSPFDGMGGGVLGIAGGIPGPVHVKGTVASGVAVTTNEIPGGPPISHVFAHELGHYLGLFHTSEQNLFGGPQMHDPLPDTPNNDESFLMHATGGGDTLSPWQGIVIRNNPWVKP
ncbi:hypothetical protein DL240_10270 [Lujinxingia litoralis]|uniref:Peptidase M43 pregnancy-associated plasma-A domain-containing protein n=1 Tax=Lujinxingia litoralis TaxID=2211119 RepID=A0A328C4P6_9DELT|nr:hypothetical protein [Lujinxingia litoralis]RAL22229.1 hypothetical protein DL240_10270 [Lujinxingia litoralis]